MVAKLLDRITVTLQACAARALEAGLTGLLLLLGGLLLLRRCCCVLTTALCTRSHRAGGRAGARITADQLADHRSPRSTTKASTGRCACRRCRCRSRLLRSGWLGGVEAAVLDGPGITLCLVRLLLVGGLPFCRIDKLSCPDGGS